MADANSTSESCSPQPDFSGAGVTVAFALPLLFTLLLLIPLWRLDSQRLVSPSPLLTLKSTFLEQRLRALSEQQLLIGFSFLTALFASLSTASHAISHTQALFIAFLHVMNLLHLGMCIRNVQTQTYTTLLYLLYLLLVAVFGVVVAVGKGVGECSGDRNVKWVAVIVCEGAVGFEVVVAGVHRVLTKRREMDLEAASAPQEYWRIRGENFRRIRYFLYPVMTACYYGGLAYLLTTPEGLRVEERREHLSFGQCLAVAGLLGVGFESARCWVRYRRERRVLVEEGKVEEEECGCDECRQEKRGFGRIAEEEET